MTRRYIFLPIEYWGEGGIQEQLEGSKHNKHVYEWLAAELVKTGSDKTAEQCRAKMKKLKLEYRKVRDNTTKLGKDRVPGGFFNALDRMLGDRLMSQPTAIPDTSAPPRNDSDSEAPEHYDGDNSIIEGISPPDGSALTLLQQQLRLNLNLQVLRRFLE